MPVTLSSLLHKALGDTGFDLPLGSEAEWSAYGVSGLPGTVHVLPVHKGAVLALSDPDVLRELTPATWTEVPLPNGAVGAVRCATHADLYRTLRRVRMLFAQLPPVPAQRFHHRLAAIGATEAETIVKRRVGQELFREMLMDYWEGKCAVTGLAVPELLRASHAKPWSASSDAERLDVYNGLLLAVHVDALFDSGLMTFRDDGASEFSSRLSAETLHLLVDCNTRMLSNGDPP